MMKHRNMKIQLRVLSHTVQLTFTIGFQSGSTGDFRTGDLEVQSFTVSCSAIAGIYISQMIEGDVSDCGNMSDIW